MTTTSQTPITQRGSSRQRRIAEQSARFEAALRAQSRRRLALVGAGVLVTLVLIVAVVLYFPRPTAAQGHQVPIEGNRQYVPQGTEMAYRNRPPSSGDHDDTPAGHGVSTRELSVGNLVHAVEHGGIVICYRPDLCDGVARGWVRPHSAAG